MAGETTVTLIGNLGAGDERFAKDKLREANIQHLREVHDALGHLIKVLEAA